MACLNWGALEIISKLMEFPKGEIDDLLSTMYTDFLKEAAMHKTAFRSETLRPLAELAYRQLKALVDYETQLV